MSLYVVADIAGLVAGSPDPNKEIDLSFAERVVNLGPMDTVATTVTSLSPSDISVTALSWNNTVVTKVTAEGEEIIHEPNTLATFTAAALTDDGIDTEIPKVLEVRIVHAANKNVDIWRIGVSRVTFVTSRDGSRAV